MKYTGIYLYIIYTYTPKVAAAAKLGSSFDGDALHGSRTGSSQLSLLESGWQQLLVQVNLTLDCTPKTRKQAYLL